MAALAVSRNRLLAAMPPSQFQSLYSRSAVVPLIYGKRLYDAGETLKYVYFVETGIISLLSKVGKNSSIEVGLIGNEGMAGVSAFLGVNTSPNLAIVQGTGTATRMTVRDFRLSCGECQKLTRQTNIFINSLMVQISQSAACNRFHPIEARLARWLLMTQDRMHEDEFQVTQEFLSNMLGVRREGVNKAVGSLQRRGLISHSRGLIRVHKRTELEANACECYEIIRKPYEDALR